MNLVVNKLHIIASHVMHKPHIFANPVTNMPHTQMFFVYISQESCRVFKKMWYAIFKCLNTNGRIGSTVESLLSNLNGTERQLDLQNFNIM
jgi:hypothetical protein